MMVVMKLVTVTLLSYWFCTAALANTSFDPAETPEAHFKELRQIILQLEDQAPISIEEKKRIDIARANTLLAKSAEGSKVNLNLQGQSVYEDRPNQSYYGREHFFGSLTVRQPLFHWGALKAQSKIALLQQSTVKNNFTHLLSELKSKARDSYLDLIVLNNQVELGKANLNSSKENFKKVEKRNKHGLSSDLIVRDANIQLLQQKIILEDLNRSLITARNKFAQLTGWSDPLKFQEVNNSFMSLQLDHDFGKSIPLLISGHSSKSAKQIEVRINAEEQNLVIAQSGLRPKVNLVGAFFQDQVPLANNETSFVRNNYLVGLEVNWALWDSSKSKAEKLKALASKRRLELNLERESRSFRLELENMRDQLKSIAKQVNMARELVILAEKKLSISKIEMESNRITISQFMDAQISLDQSKINRLQSICQYIKIRNRYQTFIISDYE